MLPKLKQLFTKILDILFPQTEMVSSLENMTVTEFLEKAPRASEKNTTDNIESLFNYRHPIVKAAVWELKYRGNTRIADLLGQIMYEIMMEELADAIVFSNFTDPMLIPVPIGKERLKTRGWNQCELLANSIIKNDGEKILSLDTKSLRKIRDTDSQTTQDSKASRLKNLKDCFAVADPQTIIGRNIILLDDITTTGATIEEARKTLLYAGAKKVIAYTIAH